MISKTSQPKSIKEVGSQISKKPSSTSFEVIEVFSKTDKTKLISVFTRFLRTTRHFSVIFIEDSK